MVGWHFQVISHLKWNEQMKRKWCMINILIAVDFIALTRYVNTINFTAVIFSVTFVVDALLHSIQSWHVSRWKRAAFCASNDCWSRDLDSTTMYSESTLKSQVEGEGCLITGPPNGPVLFCSLASVVVVCNTAGGPAARAADTARWASRVTFHWGDTLFITGVSASCSSPLYRPLST